MHDHHSPNRLHSEHALSLSYSDWLALKQHQHTLTTHHHRQQTLRNTVLTLFRHYQADTAYLCWTDEKRREGWWASGVEEEEERCVDTSAYHCQVGSEAFQQSSTPHFLQWAAHKRRQQREERRRTAERQVEEKRREEEEAQQQHERAQVEYDKWHTNKTQQLTHRRTQQHRQLTTQQAATQQQRQEQQQRANERYNDWKQHKHAQQLQHTRRTQLVQQRQAAQRADRRQQFDTLYPTAIATYVATIDKWRRDEQQARQRQVDRERLRQGRAGRSATPKGVSEVQSSATAAERPASLVDVQRVSSARLSAGKRVEGSKLSLLTASTASTAAAMSVSAAVVPSLFNSFSSISSCSSSAVGFAPSVAAMSTARSTASEPVRRMRALTHKRRVVVRPAWNEDTTLTVST